MDIQEVSLLVCPFFWFSIVSFERLEEILFECCNNLWIVDVDVLLENVFQTVSALFAMLVWNKFVMGKNKITETSNEITPQTTTKLFLRKEWSKMKLTQGIYFIMLSELSSNWVSVKGKLLLTNVPILDTKIWWCRHRWMIR